MSVEDSYYIGFDLGTSGCRGVIFDENVDTVDSVEATYPVINPKFGHQEQDPESIFQATVKVLKEANSKIPDSGNLRGIGLSTYLHSFFPVDSRGSPLTNCLVWNDRRSYLQVSELKSEYDYHDFYKRVGCPAHPMYPIFKLLWIKETHPEIFEKTEKFVSIKDYIVWKLFGEFLIDWSVASGTGFFNIHEFDWDEELLEIMGIARSQLSEPLSPETIMKGMKEKYVKKIGISPNTPIAIGAADGPLSNVGSGAIGENVADNTIGTGGAVRVLRDFPLLDEKERTWCYILTDEYWCPGAVSLGGFTYEWFKDYFAELEVDKAKEKGKDPYEILNQKASEVSPGSEGLIILPFLTGELSPNWREDSDAVIAGLSSYHRKEHFIRAIMEGVCFSRYSCFKALQDVAGEIEELRATGGFSKSHEWLQIMADVFGKKISVPTVFNTTAVGATILLKKALGEIPGIEDSKRFINYKETISPNEENHRTYEKGFRLYNDLYQKLNSLFPKFRRFKEDLSENKQI